MYPSLKQGDITTDDASIIVNTVNCVGVCGKGIALAFAQRFPHIVPDYKAACSNGLLRPGGCLVYPLHHNDHGLQYWAAFATKDHWFNSSQYDWIQSGLISLSQQAYDISIDSLALPALGCGNGGLRWSVVYPMIMAYLWWVPDLRIYPPP